MLHDLSGVGLLATSLALWKLYNIYIYRNRLPLYRDVIIAVDIGSSSIKCAAFHKYKEKYQLIPNSEIKETFPVVSNGVANAQVISTKTEFILSQCISLLKYKVANIVALGISTFAMSLVGVDKFGTPVTDVYTYAGKVGERNGELEQQSELFSLQHYKETGTVLHHPCYASTQLKYRASSVEVYKWQTLSSFLIGSWTGQGYNCPVSLSEASWMGLLNIHTMKWNPSTLAYIGIDASRLPSLSIDNSPLRFSEEWISSHPLWSVLKDTRIYLGIADGMAASLASKCDTASDKQSVYATGSVAITIGTSAAARTVVSASESVLSACEPNAGLWVYRMSSQSVLIGGALTDGGSLVDWLSSYVGLNRIQTLTEELESQYLANKRCGRPGWSGLLDSAGYPMVLPFWSGERSTGWREDARGVLYGLSHATTPALMLLGLMTGIIVRLEEVVSRMRQVVNGIECIVASGAVLERHGVWRQLLADICFLPVLTLRQKDGERTLCGVVEHIRQSTSSVDEFASNECPPKSNWDFVNSETENTHTPEPFGNPQKQVVERLKALYIQDIKS